MSLKRKEQNGEAGKEKRSMARSETFNFQSDLQAGIAGEYFVCCDLIMKGFRAYPSEQSLPYDVVLDTGKKIFKVQVKTTTRPRLLTTQRKNGYYIYQFETKRNQSQRQQGDCDIFALVSLDSLKVGYLWSENMPSIKQFRCDILANTYIPSRNSGSAMPYLSTIYRDPSWFLEEEEFFSAL